MRVSYKKQKPFDLLIPLIKGEGMVLKVSYDKKENSELLSSRFYKFNLDDTDWLPDFAPVEKEILGALEVFDLFSSTNFKSDLSSVQKAQGLYGYYFETSAAVLQKGDAVEIDVWKTKAKSLLKILETLPIRKDEASEDPREKLLQNFRDLMDALENNNYEYFGIQNTTV